MKKLETNHQNEALPIDWPSGIKAICLDRSHRGSGNHGVFLIETPQTQWVVKCYDHKRAGLQRLLSGLENIFTGRSALDPESRFQTEKETLRTWRKYGFDVFQEPDDVPSIALHLPHLVFEFVSGRTLKEFFLDPAIEKQDKLAVLERFVPEWSRRHRLTLETGNHCLIQERATFQHVFLSAANDRLIYFDFEIVYTPRHSLKGIIAREIAGYLRSLFSAVPRKDYPAYLDTIVRAYPNPEFLSFPREYFFRHPNRLLRLAFAFDRQLPRNRRPHSKYNITARIQKHLHSTRNYPE
ncbi:MAG: hypothetical protein JRF72_00195 [Deltaproteobacteria bacterium]|jgi:hypothetical protein|nr:hypothetical protein [Deltaproteobacteria bacterium]